MIDRCEYIANLEKPPRSLMDSVCRTPIEPGTPGVAALGFVVVHPYNSANAACALVDAVDPVAGQAGCLAILSQPLAWCCVSGGGYEPEVTIAAVVPNGVDQTVPGRYKPSAAERRPIVLHVGLLPLA